VRGDAEDTFVHRDGEPDEGEIFDGALEGRFVAFDLASYCVLFIHICGPIVAILCPEGRDC
jgi:hypothetical protein